MKTIRPKFRESHCRGPKSARQRRGSATVECAVCLPAFLIVVFGAIEASNALYLKQTLAIGAYEAGMSFSRTNGTLDQAETRCQEVLDARGLSDFVLTITPDDPDDVDRGETFTVQVSASMTSFSLGSFWHYSGSDLSETIYMTKL